MIWDCFRFCRLLGCCALGCCVGGEWLLRILVFDFGLGVWMFCIRMYDWFMLLVLSVVADCAWVFGGWSLVVTCVVSFLAGCVG